MSDSDVPSVFRTGLFDGKTAFPSRATQGINLAIAKRLAQLGAR